VPSYSSTRIRSMGQITPTAGRFPRLAARYSPSSPTPCSPLFAQPASMFTEDPKKGGRKSPPASRSSRENEDSRRADCGRDPQALASAGSGPETSTLGGSTLMVVMASPPSGRSQAQPLQAEGRAAGMIYNCSTRVFRVAQFFGVAWLNFLALRPEVPFAGEPRPPGEDSQGDDLALGEGGLGARTSTFGGARLAEVVCGDIERGEEGVHVEHESVPFPSGSVSKPTLVGGHLPLKSLTDNSHQAFKDPPVGAHALLSSNQDVPGRRYSLPTASSSSMPKPGLSVGRIQPGLNHSSVPPFARS